MVVFEPGDIIEIVSITDDDALHGVKVGFQGIVQPVDESCTEDETIMVLLDNLNWSYYVYPNQIRKVRSATLDTIFRAYLVKDDELLQRVKDYVNKTLNIERSLTNGNK